MNWNFIITFFVCLGVYLLGLFIFVMIKRARNKKRFNKEIKEHHDDETMELKKVDADEQENK